MLPFSIRSASGVPNRGGIIDWMPCFVAFRMPISEESEIGFILLLMPVLRALGALGACIFDMNHRDWMHCC